MEIPSIAIIGSGFSGTLTLVNLVRKSEFPLTIYLIEKREINAKGVAYGTDNDIHLLNVPAQKMSALADEPEHFIQWLDRAKQNGLINNFKPTDFLPRKLYGLYLEELLSETEIQAKAKSIKIIKINNQSVSDIEIKNNETFVVLENNSIEVDKVILALGNYPPANIHIDNPEFYKSPKYFRDPWDKNTLKNLKPEDPVLLIGSGLTMVDLALSLQKNNHTGKIYVISPHGYLPESHEKLTVYPAFIHRDNLPKTCLDAIKIIRKEIKKERGISYKSVIDSIRPYIQDIWLGFPLSEKKRFMRYLRHRWGVLRHRMPSQAGDVLKSLLEAKKIEVYAGKIKSLKEENDLIEVCFKIKSANDYSYLKVARVINCTGPESNYANITDPLIVNLRTKGLIKPDNMFLGIDTEVNGAVRDINNNISNNIFTLGSTLKGILWESTAVPEIREQALNLAKLILQQLKA